MRDFRGCRCFSMVFTQTKALKIGGKEHSECPIYLVMGLGYEDHYHRYFARKQIEIETDGSKSASLSFRQWHLAACCLLST
jgi:hypothetical protein